MAVPVVAQAAATAVTKFGPQVKDVAMRALSAATSGRVSVPEDIKKYVQSSPERLAVVTSTLVRQGVPVDDLISVELAGSKGFMDNLRARLVSIASSMRDEAIANSSKAAPAVTVADTAADEVRAARVRAALAVFGTPERYFLCQKLAPDDFAWFSRMKRAVG